MNISIVVLEHIENSNLKNEAMFLKFIFQELVHTVMSYVQLKQLNVGKYLSI